MAVLHAAGAAAIKSIIVAGRLIGHSASDRVAVSDEEEADPDEMGHKRVDIGRGVAADSSAVPKMMLALAQRCKGDAQEAQTTLRNSAAVPFGDVRGDGFCCPAKLISGFQ